MAVEKDRDPGGKEMPWESAWAQHLARREAAKFEEIFIAALRDPELRAALDQVTKSMPESLRARGDWSCCIGV